MEDPNHLEFLKPIYDEVVETTKKLTNKTPRIDMNYGRIACDNEEVLGLRKNTTRIEKRTNIPNLQDGQS